MPRQGSESQSCILVARIQRTDCSSSLSTRQIKYSSEPDRRTSCIAAGTSTYARAHDMELKSTPSDQTRIAATAL
jgi:hypothetical protein